MKTLKLEEIRNSVYYCLYASLLMLAGIFQIHFIIPFLTFNFVILIFLLIQQKWGFKLALKTLLMISVFWLIFSRGLFFLEQLVIVMTTVVFASIRHYLKTVLAIIITSSLMTLISVFLVFPMLTFYGIYNIIFIDLEMLFANPYYVLISGIIAFCYFVSQLIVNLIGLKYVTKYQQRKEKDEILQSN